jgi:hypothetical protein
MRVVAGTAFIAHGITGFLDGHLIKSELLDMLAVETAHSWLRDCGRPFQDLWV